MPETVGHAEVDVDLDTAGIAAQARSAAQNAGEEFGSEFEKRTGRVVRGLRFDREGRVVGATFGRAVGEAASRSLSRSMRRRSPFSGLESQFELAQTRILALVARFGPLVAAALGAAIAIGPAFAAALPALAAVGAAAGVIALAWDDVQKAVEPLGNMFERLQDPIGRILTDGIRPLVRELAGNLFPVLRTGLGEIAGVMNTVTRQFIEWANSAQALGILEDLLTGIAPVMQILGRAALVLTDAFARIAVAAIPAFDRLADGILDVSVAFDQWVRGLERSGALTEDITTSMDKLGSVLSDLGDIARSALRLFADFGDAGIAAFSGFADVVSGVLDSLRPLAQALSANAGSVETWARAITAAVIAVNAFKLANLLLTRALAVNPFVALAATIVGLAAAFEGVRDALAPIAEAFSSLPGPIQAATVAMAGFAAVMVRISSGGVGLVGFNTQLATMSTRAKLAGVGLLGLGTALLALSPQISEANKTAGILTQTLGGAAAGAGLGSVFGPLGIGIGGLVGGLSALAAAMLQADQATSEFERGLRLIVAQQAAERIRELRQELVAWVREAGRAAQAGRSWLRTLTDTSGAITDQTRALAVNKFRQTGLLPVTRRLGITMRQLVAAGIRPSNRAFLNLRDTLDRARRQGRLTGTEYNRLVRVLRRMREGLAGARSQHERLTGEQARGNRLLRQFANSSGLTTSQLRKMALAAAGDRRALELLSHATGISVGDLQGLIAELKEVGKQHPRPTVEEQGAAESTERVVGLGAAIGALPLSKTVSINVEVGGALGLAGRLLGSAMSGAIVTKPGLWMLGERNRKEAVVPVTMPDRAMQVMEQSGAADIVRRHDTDSEAAAPARPDVNVTQNITMPTTDPNALRQIIGTHFAAAVR